MFPFKEHKGTLTVTFLTMRTYNYVTVSRNDVS
jgi:hypothetical protein